MKYFAIVILVVLLSWTWSLATNERGMTLDQHKQIEAGVETDIRNFIHERFPYVNDVYCSQLYTETVRENSELMVHFRCEALGNTGTEEATKQTFEGSLRLRSENDFETWKPAGGKIHQKSLDFLSEIKVTPRPKDQREKEE